MEAGWEAPRPRLLDRLREVLRVRHYSLRTEEAYVDWVRRFILFHGKKHPLEMGAVEVGSFLTHLAVERKVSASTQNLPEHEQDWRAYIESAYKIYFFHFREPFDEAKTKILEINVFWAWFSYFAGIAILLGLLILVFNTKHPLISIIIFVIIWLFLRPFFAALISLAVKLFNKSRHVPL